MFLVPKNGLLRTGFAGVLRSIWPTFRRWIASKELVPCITTGLGVFYPTGPSPGRTLPGSIRTKAPALDAVFCGSGETLFGRLIRLSRPLLTAELRRTEQVKIRLTLGELEHLRAAAEAASLLMADYARRRTFSLPLSRQSPASMLNS